jgi:hypothetical protein
VIERLGAVADDDHLDPRRSGFEGPGSGIAARPGEPERAIPELVHAFAIEETISS